MLKSGLMMSDTNLLIRSKLANPSTSFYKSECETQIEEGLVFTLDLANNLAKDPAKVAMPGIVYFSMRA
jgi:hypothetical protein